MCVSPLAMLSPAAAIAKKGGGAIGALSPAVAIVSQLGKKKKDKLPASNPAGGMSSNYSGAL